MISKLLLAALFFAVPTFSFSQGPKPESQVSGKKSLSEKGDTPPSHETGSDETAGDSAAGAKARPVSDDASSSYGAASRTTWYARPDAERRFKNYVSNVAGPASLAIYAGTAGILTLRNSPREWGAKSDGFGRRFANVAAKGAVKSTTAYALDEVLKVDSTFYRSRDRGVVARLRNSVFSTVTARDRRGRRVIGIPNMAGGLFSEVVSSSGWYPSRYDYVHGLKGGGISLAIGAGVNLFKEFVWK